MSEGSIRLQVVEARLRSVTVSGNTHFGSDNIRRSPPALRESAPPNTDEPAADIRLANENPAKRVNGDESLHFSVGVAY